MKQARSFNGSPDKAINWSEIFDSDTLYNKPIGLINEVYDNTNFAKWLVSRF